MKNTSIPMDSESISEIRISIRGPAVFLEFPKKIQWIAFPPEEAIKIAQIMIGLASQASALNQRKMFTHIKCVPEEKSVGIF